MAEKKEVKKATTGNTALDAVMSQIRKEFGEMSIMRLGDQDVKEIAVIPTGALSLDLALGVGGLPRGRIVECSASMNAATPPAFCAFATT